MAKNCPVCTIQPPGMPVRCDIGEAPWRVNMASGPHPTIAQVSDNPTSRGDFWLLAVGSPSPAPLARGLPYNRAVTRLLLPLPAVFCLLVAAAPGQPPSLAPFVPTPPDVVTRMLELAGTGADDVVYDLGCGDGRIVIAAARDFGARGVGVDIDPALVEKARAAARAAGVEDRVSFRVEDAMTTDISNATVVTLYLLSASNVKLRPRLTRDLPPGARIVAHNYPIGDWEPDVVENFRDAQGEVRTLYLWRVSEPKAQLPRPN